MKSCQLLCLCLLVGLLGGTCQADEATAWLDRMGAAIREQDYQGTFTYMRGSQFDTIEVVHRFSQGLEQERMVHLNGEEREVLRTDTKVVCYHPRSPSAVFDHNVPLGPFSPAFSENLSTYQKLYRFSLHGTDRIAGRPAVKLKISPRNKDRFGYRLWLDEETGLLLQSQLVDRDRVLEVFLFSSILIGAPVSADMLASTLGEDAMSHKLSPDLTEVAENTTKPNWRVARLPAGFERVTTRQSNWLQLTDGLATVSVFIEQAGSSPLPDMATRLGATTVITRRLKGSKGQITVVGEVPVGMARRIAESVEPVVY